ncbi:MAG: hypothetical protein P4L57_15490 [Rhizomicrobium sp.]|nr:hypothetical protein [Rhizomicrobium sp.]
MSSVTGLGSSSIQASAAVFNVSAVAKPPEKSRDDYVAPIETTNIQAAKTDVSLSKMTSPSAGQHLDIRV